MRALLLVVILGAGIIIGGLALSKGAAAIDRSTADGVLAEIKAG